MPVYDFKCMKCQEIVEDLSMPITHLASAVPRCCDQYMSYHITSAPQVVWKDPNIAAFRTSAGKKPEVITTTKGRREFMARNDLHDANERYSAPTRAEEQREVAEKQASIDAITPTAKQTQQLKDSGIDSILKES